MSFNAKFDEMINENLNGLLSANETWERVQLNFVADIQSGFAFKAKHFNKKEGIPIARIRDVKRGFSETFFDGDYPKEYLINDDDFLVGMDGDSNSSKWKGGKALLNQRVSKITIVTKYYDESFFTNVIQGYLDSINYYTSSVTVKHISAKTMREIPLPLPPLNEQKRIAEKLDQILEEVNSAKARLDQIPTILKNFRQSVLQGAVSGDLTNSETFIKRTDYGFPLNWEHLKIDDIGDVKGGKRLPKGEKLVSIDTGHPYIRAGQLKNGGVDPNGQLYLDEDTQKKISRYIVRANDAYITIVGACIGDAGLIPAQYDGANLTENAAKICNYKMPLAPDFLSYWLQSPYLQNLITFEIKSGAQGKLALKRIKDLPIILPSLEEQKQIVKKARELFSLADQIEEKYNLAKEQVDKITQSVLAKAFRGELVLQDPTDEPASVLLERIKAEKGAESLKPNPKRKKKTQIESDSVQVSVEA